MDKLPEVSYFGDKLLEIRVIVWTNYLKLECIFPQNGTAVLKGSSISPLGYWQKVNQSPTQTKPYNTLPPFWTARFLVFVWGRTCLLRSSFISGDPGRVIYQILDMRKFTFLQKGLSWWTWDSNSRPTTHGPVVDAICEVTGRRQRIPLQVCLLS